MKKLTKLSWVFLLSGCLLFDSCEKKEEDPFSGSDNYITSFILKNGDKQIKATIEEDLITVTAPSNFILTAATAEVRRSENSSIKPDPASITDWSSEYIFVITAYNGQTKSYKYTVSNAGNSVPGSVILTTQAEVNAFGESGITTIEGNLIIGASSGRDSITSITPLNKLKEVGYGVIIKSTYASKTLDGLAGLEKAGGTLRIETSRLTKANLPALTSVMDIEVTSKTLEKIECPKLTAVSGKMNFSTTNLSEIDMPLLATVNGDITFTVPKQNDPSALKKIAFPALQQVDGTFGFSGLPDIESINLPELILCGAINLGNPGVSKLLTSVSFPKLEECKGELRYHNLSELQRVDLPSLKHTGSLIAYDCNNMESFNIPKLETVDGNLYLGMLGNLASEGFSNLRALTSIGGTFTIRYGRATSVSELKLPPALKTCYALDLFDCATLKSIDITGIDIQELILERATLLDLTIRGDLVFRGCIRLNGDASTNIDNPYSATYNFPRFNGILEIGGLELSSLNYMRDVVIAGISKINGNLKINDHSGIQAFSVRDLTEISGDIVTGAFSGVASSVVFSSIQKVGGYVRVGGLYSPFYCETLSFPAMTQAGGIDLSVAGSNVRNLLMPQLTTISDSLKIAWPDPSGDWTGNQSITHLDGFSNLTNVKVVYIEKMQALTSYEGLKNCIPSLTKDEQWEMNYNLYEPTLEDMRAGRWNQ